MALDNDPIPSRCFNANFPHVGGQVPTARVCDLTWFAHPSEVLLYYLLHLALWSPDQELLGELNRPDVGVAQFLSHVSEIDKEYVTAVGGLSSSREYQDSFSAVDSKAFSLAIVKAFLSRLGLSGLRKPVPDLRRLPWVEEYTLVAAEETPDPDEPEADVIRMGLKRQWQRELDNLREASGKKGRGQHSKVASRLASFVAFLETPVGKSARDMWVKWRSRRDSLRARFCTEIEQSLRRLYADDRQVQLILGGPPCKGFSRIGRAVVEQLRDQGVHAWTSKEYGDERNALVHKYVLFLEALQPDAFVFENVAHFQSSLRTPNGRLDAAAILQEAIGQLSADQAHYEIRSQVLRARQFAIPQDRERFLMVGFNADKSQATDAAREFFALDVFKEEVPLNLALQGLEEPGEFAWDDSEASVSTNHLVGAYTLVDPAMPAALRRFVEWIRQPDPSTGVRPGFVDAHVVRRPRSDDLALIRKFAPGQRWMDYKLRKANTLEELRQVLTAALNYAVSSSGFPVSSRRLEELLGRIDEGLLLRLLLEEVDPELGGSEHHLLTSGYLEKGHDRHGDWFERLSASRPSKTIVAHIGKDTYSYIHPYENRALSIREAARIQSFPDFFAFGMVGVVDGYAMIGNAVPPLLANALATQFANHSQASGLFSGSLQLREAAGVPRQLDLAEADTPSSSPA